MYTKMAEMFLSGDSETVVPAEPLRILIVDETGTTFNATLDSKFRGIPDLTQGLEPAENAADKNLLEIRGKDGSIVYWVLAWIKRFVSQTQEGKTTGSTLSWDKNMYDKLDDHSISCVFDIAERFKIGLLKLSAIEYVASLVKNIDPKEIRDKYLRRTSKPIGVDDVERILEPLKGSLRSGGEEDLDFVNLEK